MAPDESDMLVPLIDDTRAFRFGVTSGPDAGQGIVAELRPGERIYVGSDAACDLPLSDPKVSGRHAVFEHVGTRVRVTDIGAQSGTRINGVEVLGAYLSGGEVVEIGGTSIRVERGASASGIFFSQSSDATNAPSRPAVPSDPIDEIVALNVSLGEARRTLVAELERRYVRSALAQHGGNLTRAAAASGLARRYFRLLCARAGSRPPRGAR
jgi:hypothetical protein